MIVFPTLNPACVCQEGRQFLYNLEVRTNLISDSWRGVPGCTNLTGDGSIKRLANALSGRTSFYRVRLEVR